MNTARQSLIFLFFKNAFCKHPQGEMTSFCKRRHTCNTRAVGCQSCGPHTSKKKSSGLLHFKHRNVYYVKDPRAKPFRGCRRDATCLQVQALDATVFPQPSDSLAMTAPSQPVLLIPFTAG